MKKVLFLGAPGVGKGTFAKRIAPRLNLKHLSAGELLRAHVKAGSSLGNLAKPFLDKGMMVPSEHSISKLNASSRVNGYILDGFPRVLEQAKMWSDLAMGDGNPELVINISLARSVLVHKLASRRICGGCGDNYNLADIRYGQYDMPPMLPKLEGICDTCGSGLIRRDDDSDDIIQHRLELHFEKEEPLLDFYRNCPKTQVIDFQVTRGIQQTDSLLEIIETYFDDNASKR
ncbi:hypothetical protein FOL47_010511 [Perkinsus chesapeaki]|uniref:Adenylate kinase active site lid domain-containing protein n=1 Tax=Perkinsus chesapeaki TaxID=330153 RepID=A0A7J6MPD3_PERCH|nr:hypothetical protein FOL47_010511 [Perkinsus chesapeaki]